MDPALLDEPQFTDVAPPDRIRFPTKCALLGLFQKIQEIDASAVA